MAPILARIFRGHSFWTAVDASLDPCEPNYVMSQYVAEPFSALSALGLILAGSNAIHQSRKYNFETRFMLLGFAVVVMGASSAFFHVTLSQRAKGWEEMAMVWTAFGWLCVLTQMSNSSTNETPSIVMVASLGLGLWMSQLDIPIGPLIFGSRMILLVLSSCGMYFLNDCVKRYCNLELIGWSKKDLGSAAHPSTLKLQLMARWQLACGLLAFLVLVASDMFCTSMCNFQLHALWHLLIGLSCHYGLQFAMALRQSILHKAPPATSWSLGGLLGCVVPTEVPSRAMGAQLRWLLKMAGVDRLDSV